MTSKKFETEFKFLPPHFVVHIPGQFFESLNDNRNLNHQMVYIIANSTLLFHQTHAVECYPAKISIVKYKAVSSKNSLLLFVFQNL